MSVEQAIRPHQAMQKQEEFELLPGMAKPEVYRSSFPGMKQERKLEDEHLKKCVAASYVKGYQKGLEEARVWKEQSIFDVRAMIESADRAFHSFQASYETELISLVVGLAEKIIRHEIAADIKGSLEKHIKSCLKLIDREAIVKIKLSHPDIRLVSELFDEDQSLNSIFEGVIIEEDSAIERGGCIIETEGGTLRATISSQIEKLSQILEREHGKRDQD